MPKVSEEHKERRREQILEGARRCFARHGYEGATVARLEQEIGLSRGAIFNYFPSKDALFIELALEMSKRLTDVWLHDGFRAVLDAIVSEDPDWLAVQLEATRRIRTDAEFRELIERREEELEGHARRTPRTGPAEGARRRAARGRSGLPVVRRERSGAAARMGDPLPDLDVIAQARRRRRRAALAASRGRSARVPRRSAGDGCSASCAASQLEHPVEIPADDALRSAHGAVCPRRQHVPACWVEDRARDRRLVAAEPVGKDRLRHSGLPEQRQSPDLR